jgi:hypothetical protein
MAMAAASLGGSLGFLIPRRRSISFSAPRGARRRPPLAVVRAASYEAGVGVMATKVGMMTYFDPDNWKPVPVTVVGFRDGENVVTQVKTAATDGYDSVQVGYHGVREDKLTRPELGHLGKAARRLCGTCRSSGWWPSMPSTPARSSSSTSSSRRATLSNRRVLRALEPAAAFRRICGARPRLRGHRHAPLPADARVLRCCTA